MKPLVYAAVVDWEQLLGFDSESFRRLNSYSSVGLTALSVGSSHKGRDEEDGGAHICCCDVLLMDKLIDR